MSNLKTSIENYCRANSINIPTGFNRRSVSRYVVIKKKENKWQLVAKTYFNVSDVINYIENYCKNIEYRIFDFKKMVELKRKGEKQIESICTI